LHFVGTEILGVGKVSVDKYLEKLNTRNKNSKYGNVKINLKLKLCKHEPICSNCFVRFGMDLEMKSGLILIDLHIIFILRLKVTGL
jgi:hypothetical protein